MRIMSIDPGGTTGWAVVDSEEVVIAFGHLGGGSDERGMNTALAIFDMVNMYDVGVLLVEDFYLRPSRSGWSAKREGLSPVRIGAYLYALYMEDHVGVRSRGVIWTWQQPSEMAVITSARLKAAGMWVKGEHARDAVKHAIVYLRKQAT